MTYYIVHHLYGKGIKETLMRKDCVRPAILHGCAHPQGRAFLYVLDYAKCNAEAWQKDLQQILKQGVVNRNKYGPDGKGLRRDYTEKEKSELHMYPVHFNEEGTEMTWVSAETCNDTPAFYASCAVYPETVMFVYEGLIHGCYISNGVGIAELTDTARCPFGPTAFEEFSFLRQRYIADSEQEKHDGKH